MKVKENQKVKIYNLNEFNLDFKILLIELIVTLIFAISGIVTLILSKKYLSETPTIIDTLIVIAAGFFLCCMSLIIYFLPFLLFFLRLNKTEDTQELFNKTLRNRNTLSIILFAIGALIELFGFLFFIIKTA
ncbi:MAG: hypothetical protein ACTSQE_13490 [Candidatus Heimdallarchaeaceae archaeon]